MSFIVELVLLTTVFGQNPMCSTFYLGGDWLEDYMPYGCKREAQSVMVNGVPYRCCNECIQCFEFEGAKCVANESKWPNFDAVCTGSIDHCKKEKQQGNCGEVCICQECEDDRVWSRKNGVSACYLPEELNSETPYIPPSGDDVCSVYYSEQMCLECAVGYTLENGGCIPTNCYYYEPVGYIKNQCKKCNGGFYLKEGICVEILNDNCTDYLYNGDCNQCKPGFNKYVHTCVPQYCKTFKPDGSNAECTSCEWNYKLVNGFCVLDTDNGDNVECLESITYKYVDIYHTHCTKCPEGYLLGHLKSYCRKAKTVQWQYDDYESAFMCLPHCKNNQFSYTENNANCMCNDCADYYERVNYLGNEICLPTLCVEPLIPESSNVLDLDGLVHCGKCVDGYKPSMNMVTGSICVNSSNSNHNKDDGTIKEFILLIVLIFLII